MHAAMTAVTKQSNQIVSNEIKENEVLLEPFYGKTQMNFLANPYRDIELLDHVVVPFLVF